MSDVDKTDADPSAQTVHEEAGPMPQIPGAELLRRGQSVGRYVVVEKIGAGSMGVVYRAFDPDLDRGIALKLLQVRRRRGRKSAEIKARLLREAQAIARVQHPNVIQVFDVGGVDDGIFVAMEFVDGVTLKKWMETRERPWREVVQVFLHAGAGLAAAHAADIVHRDFKPDNVMVGDDLRVRVLDFGLARAAGGFSSEHSGGEDDDIETVMLERRGSFAMDQSLTTDGTVVGTPAYMSPEQHAAVRAGAASDQFSFCVALWEALYGERPFSGETRHALAIAMRAGKITPPPSERRVPRWLHQAVVQGLAVAPADRHTSMDALLDALGRDPTAKWRRIAIGSGAVAIATTAVLAARAASEEPEVCTGASEKLAAVWSADRATAIAAAFDASPLPFAPDSWTKAERSIAAFAERWADARVDACRATRVHGEQSEKLMDLRIACLDRKLARLDALLRVLSDADRDAVIGAVDGTDALGNLDECRDADALTAAMPPPQDPADREEAVALQAALAEANALVDTGAYKRIGPQLLEIESRVHALNYPPVTEDFLATRAMAQQATGGVQEARKLWEAAFREALAAGAEGRAAFLAGKLTYVTGHLIADPETGQFWADTAHALLRRVDDEGRTRATVWSAEASMAMTRGDYPHARELDERLIQFWRARGDNDLELGNALGNAAVVDRELGEIDAAEAHARESLTLFENHYGPEHPEAGSASRRLAVTLTVAGEHERARELLERALAIGRASYGNGTEVALILDGLGRALRALDRLEDAEARHREAYEIWLGEYGPTHPDVAVALMNIGYTQLAANKDDDALVTFTAAGEAYEKAMGRDHPSRLYVASALAQLHLRRDDPQAGVPLLEEALALAAAATIDPTLVAELEFLLAQSLGPTGAHKLRAVELARKALAAYREKAKHWGPQIAEIEGWLREHSG